MRLTGDYQLSSDIMQESFTRYMENYSPKTQNVSLLFTIARNAVWDNSRKKALNKENETDIESKDIDPEQLLLVRESYRQVLSAMQTLDKDQRDILALTVSSDLSYREIATIIGISEANVKVKVHRARIRLKKILQTEDN
jgi:RNA polymerase sigma-70 factor (ECF subfamily)